MALPWKWRRWCLNTFLGFKIHSGSGIGIALVLPKHLVMEDHSSVGHLTVCKGLDRLVVGQFECAGPGVGRVMRAVRRSNGWSSDRYWSEWVDPQPN